MIQVLSQTKKYITFKMPIKMAEGSRLFSSYVNDARLGKVKVATIKNIQEVKPTKREVAAIKKGREQIKAGNFVSFSDIKKKYGW